ncbi:hypothetical protein D3C74_389080 [compost metagenome]
MSTRPSSVFQASRASSRISSNPTWTPSRTASASRLPRAPSTLTKDTPTLTSTSRSVVVSNTATAPLRPVVTWLVVEPAV